MATTILITSIYFLLLECCLLPSSYHNNISHLCVGALQEVIWSIRLVSKSCTAVCEILILHYTGIFMLYLD